jgi:transposase
MLPSILFAALPPDFPCELVDLESTETQVCLTLASVAPEATCPRCQVASRRVHSLYQRRLWDLPVGTRSVCLYLHLRKFRCDNPACPQTIFAERLSPWLEPYARRTQRLDSDLAAIGCENGGEGGARLARRLRLGRWSPNVLLRLTRHLSDPSAETPRVLGIDDWAKRKGQTYGTILCDLERHQVIELLADREADTVAAWLQAHPGVEIICRDRGGAYAEGARRGAPTAVQVADRFHLLMNASETVQRVVDRHRDQLHVEIPAAVPVVNSSAPPSKDDEHRPYYTPGWPRPAQRPSQIQAHRALKRRQRAERWDEARALIAQGLSRRAVRQQLHMGKATLRRVLQTEGSPSHASLWRTLRGFADELTRQWQNGEHNAHKLYTQIRAQGYRGSYQLVLRFLQPLRQQLLAPVTNPPPAAPNIPSPAPVVRMTTRQLPPRLVTRCLAGNPPANSEDDQRQVAQLCDTVPELAVARDLATSFRTLLTEHQREQLVPWLERAASSSLVEFQAFADSLRRDQTAVEWAIATRWSSGQVEGQVNRLKLIKRKMYGRGKLDLLRKRVMYRSSAIT